MRRRSSSWAAVLGVGLTALLEVGAVVGGMQWAASRFELGFDGRHVPVTESATLEISDSGTVAWRITLEGLRDSDPVAPSIAISSANVAKLRRPVGAYLLRLVLAIRDDVEDNPVGYAVIVKGGGLELARRVGSTASVTVRITFRVRPPSSRVRRISFRVTAADPAGNESSLTRSMTLPREAHGATRRLLLSA